ncbi:MAG: phosphodiesterase [Gammaproteobacteria bacterium]|nr:phosphodiesterase [Gammaproteobacteria bacterium]
MTPATGALHIVQISDCHLAQNVGPVIRGVDPDETLAGVLELVRVSRPDYCLATGDLSDEGSTESYERLLDYLHVLEVPIACLPGNHDDAEVMRRMLPGANIGMPEVLDLGAWRIVLLDSTIPGCCPGHLSEERLAGLAAHLRDRPEAHHLIALHHPALPSGCAWMDDDMLLDNPEDLFATIRDVATVRGVIWGHIHQDFFERVEGIPCWGAPATSVQFLPNSRDFRADERMPGLRHLWLNQDGSIESRIERVGDV